MSGKQMTYVREVKYENYLGEEKTKKLHFHLTPREFADWMSANMAKAFQLRDSFQGLMAKDDKDTVSPEGLASMTALIKLLCELSYGIPSEDGEVFDKSGGKQFVQSAAYEAFALTMFLDPEEMTNFVNTVLNPEVVNKFMEGIKKTRGFDEEKLEELLAKNPMDLSREELLALMQKKTQTPEA